MTAVSAMQPSALRLLSESWSALSTATPSGRSSPAQAGFSSGSRRAMSSTSPRRRRRRSPASMVRTPPPTMTLQQGRPAEEGSVVPVHGSRGRCFPWDQGRQKLALQHPRSWHLRHHAHQGKGKQRRAAVRAWACGHGRGAGPWPCKFFRKKRNPVSEEKNTGQIAKPKAERKKREEKNTALPCTHQILEKFPEIG